MNLPNDYLLSNCLSKQWSTSNGEYAIINMRLLKLRNQQCHGGDINGWSLSAKFTDVISNSYFYIQNTNCHESPN
jgi:hypothetical protein